MLRNITDHKNEHWSPQAWGDLPSSSQCSATTPAPVSAPLVFLQHFQRALPSFLPQGLCTCYSLCLEYSFSASSHLPWPKQLLFPLLGNSNLTSLQKPSRITPFHTRLGPTEPFIFSSHTYHNSNLLKQYIFFSLNGMSKEKRKPHLLVHHSTPSGEPTPCSSINIYWVNK